MCTNDVDLSKVETMLVKEIGWMTVRSVEFDDHLDGYRFVRTNGKDAFLFSSAVLGFTYQQQPAVSTRPRLEV